MKIVVVLPSRSNPKRMLSVVTALAHLASGRHDVCFHIFIDDDDQLTIETLKDVSWIGATIRIEVGSGQVSHFRRINQACMTLEMDAMTWFTDDVFPLTFHWDIVIANEIEAGRTAVAWTEATDPNHVTFPILSKRWIDAIGYVFPEYFPYWFVDSWIMETYELTYCTEFPISRRIHVAGRRAGTANMHDLLFWFQFFNATRCERVNDAKRAAVSFTTGTTASQVMEVQLRQCQRVQGQIARIPEFEQRFGSDIGPKSERYLKLKRAADDWMSKPS